MKYAFIALHSGEFRIRTQCRVLEVARSGFYAWLGRSGRRAERSHRREVLDASVAEAFRRNKGRYGTPRLTADLRSLGILVTRKTVARSLSRQGLRAKTARTYRATPDSSHSNPVVANLLCRGFGAEGPNRKSVQDMTSLRTDEGLTVPGRGVGPLLPYRRGLVHGRAHDGGPCLRYVADGSSATRDASGSHRPLGPGQPLCLGASSGAAASQREPMQHERQGRLLRQRLRRKLLPHPLKGEAIQGTSTPTREELRRAVFEYLSEDYNRNRRHSANGYLSPEVFEVKWCSGQNVA